MLSEMYRVRKPDHVQFIQMTNRIGIRAKGEWPLSDWAITCNINLNETSFSRRFFIAQNLYEKRNCIYSADRKYCLVIFWQALTFCHVANLLWDRNFHFRFHKDTRSFRLPTVTNPLRYNTTTDRLADKISVLSTIAREHVSAISREANKTDIFLM